jgi:hypothetical protein
VKLRLHIVAITQKSSMLFWHEKRNTLFQTF